MKKLVLFAALMVSGAIQSVAHADSGTAYRELLVEEDVMRTFWSPCAERQLGQVELEEIESYKNQGFVLIAKILMLQVGSQSIPECQYTFVRQGALK